MVTNYSMLNALLWMVCDDKLCNLAEILQEKSYSVWYTHCDVLSSNTSHWLNVKTTENRDGCDFVRMYCVYMCCCIANVCRPKYDVGDICWNSSCVNLWKSPKIYKMKRKQNFYCFFKNILFYCSSTQMAFSTSILYSQIRILDKLSQFPVWDVWIHLFSRLFGVQPFVLNHTTFRISSLWILSFNLFSDCSMINPILNRFTLTSSCCDSKFEKLNYFPKKGKK